MPLSHKGRARRRYQARRERGMRNWMKALLAIGGALVAFGIVAIVILIIVFPPFFRGLEPRYQQRLIGIFPPLESLKPTVPFEVLPTLSGGDSSDAAHELLLGTDDITDAPITPQETDVLAPGLTPTPTEGGIPVGAVGTPVPTPLPIYVSPTPAEIIAAAPTWTPVGEPTSIPLPPGTRLSGIKYEMQGWNNCGPTTMTMALTYFGWGDNQYTAARWMKPNTEDKNVSPWQMVRFVNDHTGVKALYRIGGTTTLIKRLLAAGFPVVIEEGLQDRKEGWLGHYVLLIGYDDSAQHFLTFDSYLGSNQQQGRPSPYSVFDEGWRQFNRLFMVVYEPSREGELRYVLGDYADPLYAAKVALETARAEATQNADDKWAWFNMGSAYVALQDYDNATIAFDRAFQLDLPFRMLWYQFGPYEAFYNVGDYNNVLALANNTLASTRYVEEIYYWQGMAYAAQGQTEVALQRFNDALRFNPNFYPAQDAKSQVEAGTFQVAAAR
jgi:hypothetical protein